MDIDIDIIRARALKAVEPVKPADDTTNAEKNLLLSAKRTNAGRQLPEHYLVYFLLVDLLGFKNLGRWEKLAWSVPIDFKGRAYLIEHRKFGVGVFAGDGTDTEAEAAEIVEAIKRGVKAAKPYFEWIAEQAVANSHLNVENRSRELLDRYHHFFELYQLKAQEAEDRKNEKVVTEHKTNGGKSWSTHFPAFGLRREAKWLAIATIDAFFSWTEHILIHLAILRGTVTTGDKVAQLALGDWKDKFKAAIDITEPTAKEHYDTLFEIRRQIRNFLAHGAFGKDGQAFDFHSSAGAVPVRLPHQRDSGKYSLGSGLEFDEPEALEQVAKFIEFLQTSLYRPAYLYAQDSDLPLILTMAKDGTYADAVKCEDTMIQLIDRLSQEWDNSVNMDW